MESRRKQLAWPQILLVASTVCFLWGACSYINAFLSKHSFYPGTFLGIASVIGLYICIIRQVFPRYFVGISQWTFTVLLFFGNVAFSDEGCNLLWEMQQVEEQWPKKTWQPAWRTTIFFTLAITLIFQAGVLIVGWRRKVSLEKRAKEVDQLRADLDLVTKNSRALVVAFLTSIGNELDFGMRDDQQERITLYFIDEVNGKQMFVNSGRHSKNPHYDKTGRVNYPVDKGFIGQAFRDSWVFENFDKNNGDGVNYKAWHKQSGIIGNVVDDLTMNADLYCGKCYRIENKPVAILMIEADDKDRFRESELKEFLDKKDHDLTVFFTFARKLAPVLSASVEAGF